MGIDLARRSVFYNIQRIAGLKYFSTATHFMETESSYHHHHHHHHIKYYIILLGYNWFWRFISSHRPSAIERSQRNSVVGFLFVHHFDVFS